MPPLSLIGPLALLRHRLTSLTAALIATAMEQQQRGRARHQSMDSLAWLSFTLCMSASVLTLNTYTKTILEFKYRRRIFEKNVRECNPFLDAEMVRFLWEKYIFSVSGSLEDPLNWHKGFGSPVFLDVGSITDLPGSAKKEERRIEVEDDGEQC